MRVIDLNTWERKEIYDFFSGVSNPFYMVSFVLDVTELKAYTKRNQCSFYYALIHLCDQAMKKVENFLYAQREGNVVLLDSRIPSFTDRKKDAELFHIVTVKDEEDLLAFTKKAKEVSEAQNCFIDFSSESDNLAYYSCLPTLRLTALTNEFDVLSSQLKNDSVPRIAWGRYTEHDGRLELTMSMEVNHRFIDGLHIEKFAQYLQQSIDQLKG